MSEEFLSITYGVIAGGATLAGIGLLMLGRDRVLRWSHHLNSFAAGAILAIAFLHLMPHSLEHNDKALIFIFGGFMAFYFLEAFFVLHSGAAIHYRERRRTRGMVAFYGLFFHSLVDGVIIGAGFEADTSLGVVLALGIILHELPEGMTTFSMLLETLDRKRAVWMSVAVALATPLGTTAVFFDLDGMSAGAMGGLVGVAAGSFLYIAASDLIPETHEGKGYQNALFLLAGVIAMALLSGLVGAG